MKTKEVILLRERLNKNLSSINKAIPKLYNESIAKTSGLSLYEHTFDVLMESLYVTSKRKRSIQKYCKLLNKTPEQIFEALQKAIAFHDFGKSYSRWQKYAKDENLQEVKFRHEIGFIPVYLDCKNYKYTKEEFTEIIKKQANLFISILAHHANLHRKKILKFDSYGNDVSIKTTSFGSLLHWDDKPLSETLTDIYDRITTNLKDDELYRFWYENVLYRHWLQLSDKRASCLEAEDDMVNIYNFEGKVFYKLNKNWTKRNIQKITSRAKEQLVILRSPTGSGKTSAALLWASNQFKQENCERLIVAMPTQFTSNALSDSIKADGLKNVYTQHSAAKHYQKIDDWNELIYSKTFENVVNVSTIDQILYSFTLSKEEHQSRAFNVVNSCVVIDEADFYDDFVLANILQLLKILKHFEVPVLIMSATLPDKFVELINKELGTNIKIKDDVSDLDRTRVKINKVYRTKMSTEYLLRKSVDKEQVIIYANTIKRAKEFYSIIMKHIDPSRKDEVVLYHSEFKRCDKDIKEAKIMELLGKDGKKRGIVIMTQIGELSINVSSNYMITDICPIDRLVQRFGRGCRFDNDVCEVDVIIPHKDGKVYPAPYGRYDLPRRKWKAFENFSKTINILSEKSYNGKDYLNMINTVYDKMDFSTKAKVNAKQLVNCFVGNVVFNSSLRVDEDDPSKDDNIWKSRDILEQIHIMVGLSQTTYQNLKEWENMIFHNALTANVYVFKKLDSLGFINKVNITISDNPELDDVYVYVIESKHYSSELGLKL